MNEQPVKWPKCLVKLEFIKRLNIFTNILAIKLS